MFDNIFTICPDECYTNVVYPAIEIDQLCTDFQVFESQVNTLLFRPDNADSPTDWSIKRDWLQVIDNADTSNQKVKLIKGEGGVLVPTKTISQIGVNHQFVAARLYTLTYRTKNLSDLMYAFLQKVQFSETKFTFNYMNIGGHIFGGEDGIRPWFTDVDFVYADSRDTVEEATITFRWFANSEPERAEMDHFTSKDLTGSSIIYDVWGYDPDNVLGYEPEEILG